MAWIKLHRSSSDNILYFAEPFTKWQAWQDLILFANYEDKRVTIGNQIISVNRGQIAWSEVTMADRWKWSRGKVRRFLKVLETEQQIAQQKFNVTSLITIINYEKHQGDDTAHDTSSSTADGTSSGTSDGTQHKNIKNLKNKRKNNSRFDSLWESYPSKDGKKQAEKHYYATVKTDEDFQNIQKALDNYNSHLKANPWKRPKNGSTWFNNWQDWIDWKEPEGGQGGQNISGRTEYTYE